MSDATKYSSLPRPTTTGGPLRTVTIVSGSSAEIRTSANRPRSCFSARRTAAASPSPRLSFSTRCATISVSVSVTNLWPFGGELALQLEIVLDDAVVHDDDAAVAVAMRMRVLRRGPAVRRPARVADAELAVERIAARARPRGCESLPALRRIVHLAVLHDRDARRVVAAVLEPAQSLDEDRQQRFGPTYPTMPHMSLGLLRDLLRLKSRAPGRRPARLVRLPAARDRQRIGRDVLGDGRAGADVRALPDRAPARSAASRCR